MSQEPTADPREELSQTFDQVAEYYQRARPEYPDQLFEHLIAVTRLRPGDRLLEVGCATGKATLPLAQRGFHITCVEPGRDLAAVARRNLVPFPKVEIVEERFEQWSARTCDSFDLVFAATAWHWVDPAVRYQRAWSALRPGGHLAFWDALHVFPDAGDPFFGEIQEVYQQIGKARPPEAGWPRPGELDDRHQEIDRSGLFDVVDIRHFDWEQAYDADTYIELLETFSGHIAMKAWQRDRLFGEIRRRLEQRPERTLRRHWVAVLVWLDATAEWTCRPTRLPPERYDADRPACEGGPLRIRPGVPIARSGLDP